LGSGGNNAARGGGTGDFSANGQRTTQNNFILDGVDNNVNADDLMNGASYNVRPPPDALAEFKIDTANYSAEFGHSAGAVLNAGVKSGTNQIHGDLWEYIRNTDLDAMDWNATTTPPYHENQFGATLGLPIWKNKIFYFADAEDNRINYAGPMTFSVPTYAERNGDFSELFNTALTGKAVPIGIFAPNTAGELPLTATGGAFPNPGGASVTALNSQPTTNVMNPGEPPLAGGAISGPTTGEMDTVGQEILNDYPQPNTAGWTAANFKTPGSGEVYNNLLVNMATRDDTWQWDQRMDFNVSPKDQTYARFSYTHDQVANTPPLGPILDGGNDTHNYVGTNDFNLARNFMVSETHLITPKLINEFRLGYNWGKYAFIQSDSTVPASTLVPGMGGVPNTGTPEPNGGLPMIAFNGTVAISAAGQRRDVPCVERQNIYQILDNVTDIWGRHSLKIGMELQSIRASISQPRFPRGYYQYDGKYSQLYGVGNTGTGMADLFTDNMDGAQIAPDWNASYYRWYRAAYAQDDWKVNSKLTVNLGVRYDFFEPISNNAGDVVNFVTLSQGLNPSTGAGTGTANWIMSSQVEGQNLLPSNFTSELTAENINVIYQNSKSLANAQKDNFGPRIGLAYQIGSKTVVRAAYGVFFSNLEIPGADETTINYPFAYNSSFNHNYLTSGACNPSDQAGASNTNSQCPSNGTVDLVDSPPLPYAMSLETGFSGYLTHGGIIAFAGTPNVNNIDPNVKTPYTQNYNLTVERQFTPNIVGTVAYVGNNGRHISTTNTFGGSLAVTNPHNPVNTVPFVGFNFTQTAWNGESMYNGLQAKIEKRYSKGLSFLASYTWQHAEDDSTSSGVGGGVSPIRNTNLIPTKYEFTNSTFDARQRFTLNGFYELPFGKGRKWTHEGGAMDYLVGGWSTSLTFVAQTGNPFTVGPGGNFVGANGGYGYNAIRVGKPFAGGGTVPAGNVDMSGHTCPATVKNKTNWYNPCAFVDPLSGLNIPLSGPGSEITDMNTAISYLGGKSNQIYGPGYEHVNMSAFKNFKTWRTQYFQFRADAFNLLNHPSWGSPSDTSLNPSAGLINTSKFLQNYTPDARFFQLSGKYVF
jgi:hypothetical protein